jgi:hypothetical protein
MPQPQQHIPPWWTDPTENVKKLVDAAMQRQDDLRVMESLHVRELLTAESARIDAIRAVDVGAVQRAAEVQAAQAAALATQVTTTADAFRASIAAALEPIQKDIRDLRDAQSRGLGVREQVVESRDTSAATRLNLGAVVGVAGLIIALVTVLYLLKK